MYVCVCAHVRKRETEREREKTCGIGSFLPPCESQGSHSGVRLGSNHLSLLSHLIAPQLCTSALQGSFWFILVAHHTDKTYQAI